MQTSVATMQPGFPGLIGDARKTKVQSFVNEEASAEISFGVMVKLGSGANGALKLTPFLILQVIADTVFTAANATNIFTAVAHGMLTGDGPVQVSNAGGGLPAGLTAVTDYYVIKLTANTFKLATTRALALAGTAVDITTDGTGTQTLADVATTKRITTYNLAGILAHDHANQKPEELGDTGLKPKARLGLMIQGPSWVLVEGTLPARTDRVHVRAETFAGQTAGAFRATGDSGTTYDISSFSQWTGRTGSTFAPLVFADATFTADNTTEICTIAAHGLQLGDGPFQVSNSGGGLPAGLAVSTNYWVIPTGANTFKLASSLANALAGTAINITSNGTGTQTMSDVAGTLRGTWFAELDFKRINQTLLTVDG